jgi:hypothetical protein
MIKRTTAVAALTAAGFGLNAAPASAAPVT